MSTYFLYWTSGSPEPESGRSMGATERKLLSFGQLASGWHYGIGGPIAEARIKQALRLHSLAASLGFTKSNAFPGAQGEILLTFYRGPHDIEIEIAANDAMSFIHEEDGNELDCGEQLTLREITQKLRGASERIWGLLDSSIPTIMILKKDASGVWHSRTPTLTAELPSSSWNAFRPLDYQFVPISGSTIHPERPVSHLYSGSSPERISA